MRTALLFVAGLALAVPGVDAVYHQVRNQSPVVTTCAEYGRAPSSAVWLRALDCEVDYLGAGYRESGGAIRELFFPVRPAGAARTEPAAIVAATREPSVLAIAESGIGSGKHPDQEQFLVMMLKIVTALGASRQIEGMARAGILDRIRTRRVLSGLTAPLAPGAVVIDLHAQPSLLLPALQAAAGLGLLIVAAVLFVRDRRSRSQESAEAPEAAPTAVAGTVDAQVAGPLLEEDAALGSYPSENGGQLIDVAPAARLSVDKVAGTPLDGTGRGEPVRVRGLLLLNLGSDGGLQDIEAAAPLGPRDATIRRIRRTIFGIEFDARGRGSVRGAGYAVIVDIGLEDPTRTAIAGADGASGADAIRRLLLETGWRAYAPRAGRFTEPEDLEDLAASAGASR